MLLFTHMILTQLLARLAIRKHLTAKVFDRQMKLKKKEICVNHYITIITLIE